MSATGSMTVTDPEILKSLLRIEPAVLAFFDGREWVRKVRSIDNREVGPAAWLQAALIILDVNTLSFAIK